MSTEDAIKKFLASGGKITRCPPGRANAKSLAQLRREADRALEDGAETINVLARRGGRTVNPYEEERAAENAERAAERYMEGYHEARSAGWSQSDALDNARDLASRED